MMKKMIDMTIDQDGSIAIFSDVLSPPLPDILRPIVAIFSVSDRPEHRNLVGPWPFFLRAFLKRCSSFLCDFICNNL